MTVPSTVLSGLVNRGIYPDPRIGMNNMRIPDASDSFNEDHDLTRFSHLPGKRNPWTAPFWFWTKFRLPEGFGGEVIRLHLYGINYRADIWLNGHLVADSSEVVGMFGNRFIAYGLASVYAQRKEVKKALEKFRLAVQSGFEDVSALGAEKDFLSLGSESEFREILRVSNVNLPV